MSMVNVSNLVQIRHWIVPDEDKNDDGYYKTVYKFQNVNPNKGIVYGSNTYSFCRFIYNGATRTRTGDNLQASLAVSTNQIAMDTAYDIVLIDFNSKQHHIKRQVIVRTCIMDSDFDKVRHVLSEERWIGASMNYNEDVVEIELASAVDAVFAGLPNQYLDEITVGRLPTTARVQTS